MEHLKSHTSYPRKYLQRSSSKSQFEVKNQEQFCLNSTAFLFLSLYSWALIQFKKWPKQEIKVKLKIFDSETSLWKPVFCQFSSYRSQPQNNSKITATFSFFISLKSLRKKKKTPRRPSINYGIFLWFAKYTLLFWLLLTIYVIYIKILFDFLIKKKTRNVFITKSVFMILYVNFWCWMDFQPQSGLIKVWLTD